MAPTWVAMVSVKVDHGWFMVRTTVESSGVSIDVTIWNTGPVRIDLRWASKFFLRAAASQG